jgi:hypothetical protein
MAWPAPDGRFASTSSTTSQAREATDALLRALPIEERDERQHVRQRDPAVCVGPIIPSITPLTTVPAASPFPLSLRPPILITP